MPAGVLHFGRSLYTDHEVCKKATSKVCNAESTRPRRHTMPVLTWRASISPAVTFGAVDGPDVRCASSSSSSSSPSSSFSSFSRFRRTRSDDAVLARLPKVTTISDDDLLHLIVSMQRKAQRRAQVLPCLVSKAAAKAASKSAASKAQLLCHYLDAFAAAELGWLTSTLWLTVFLDSLTDDQLLQAITAMVQEVHRRAQQVLDRSRANADDCFSRSGTREPLHVAPGLLWASTDGLLCSSSLVG